MPNLRRLFRYVQPYWKQMAVAIVALLASSLLILALPWAVSLLVDSVFTTDDAQLLNQVALGLLVLFVLQSLFFLVEIYLLASVGQHVVADLRLAIHRHLLVLPLHFYDNRRTGEMVSRVTNDVTVVQAILTDTPAAFLRQVVTFAGGLALMLYLNWQLTLFILVLLPPLIACGVFFGRRLERLSTQVQDRLADSTTVLEESISGVRVVKSFGQGILRAGALRRSHRADAPHRHAPHPRASGIPAAHHLPLLRGGDGGPLVRRPARCWPARSPRASWWPSSSTCSWWRGRWASSPASTRSYARPSAPQTDLRDSRHPDRSAGAACAPRDSWHDAPHWNGRARGAAR